MQRFKNQIRVFFKDEKFCDKALELPQDKLEEIIVTKRLEELKHEATNLSADLLNKGRCPKCTLRIPCKHFKDLPSVRLDYPASYSPIANEKPVFYQEIFKRQYKNPRKTKKKLEIQENIQNFKEQKLKNELEKLQVAEKQIFLEQSRQKSQDLKRRRYFEVQKEKIKKHKEQKQCSIQKLSISSSKSSRVKSTNRKPFKFQHKMEEIECILQSHSPYLS